MGERSKERVRVGERSKERVRVGERGREAESNGRGRWRRSRHG